MKRVLPCFSLVLCLCSNAFTQGVIGDVFSGRLVNPTVGAWAWYDISGGKADDGGTLQLGMMRLAIVGEEKVGDKQGYWLEMQYVPSVGYPSFYKMLLTGPADDPANVHKVFRREGTDPMEEVPLAGPKGAAEAGLPESPSKGKQNRKLVGNEDVQTPSGAIGAEHYKVADDADQLEIWLNESVSPMGIVQMKSGDGGLLLRKHGKGGDDALSLIEKPPLKSSDGGKGGVKVDVRVEKEPEKKGKEKKPAEKSSKGDS